MESVKSAKSAAKDPILPAVGTACAVGEILLNHGSRFVDGQRAATEVLAIERIDRLFGVVIAHRDETKAFRTSCLAVRNDAHGLDSADLFKKTGKFFFCRSKR